jgi:hypothetical protein
MIVLLINLLIYVIVVGLLLAVVFWVLDAVPVPQPFHNIIRIIAIVIAALVVILLLLQLTGVVVPGVVGPPLIRP